MNKLASITDYLRRPGAEDELLRAVVPRTHLSDDSFYDFGLPNALEARRQARRERLYHNSFIVGMVLCVFIGGILFGWNVHGYLAAH